MSVLQRLVLPLVESPYRGHGPRLRERSKLLLARWCRSSEEYE